MVRPGVRAGGTRERRASSAFEYDKEAWDAEVLSKAQEQLSKLSDQKYEDQAIHFLNAYWREPSIKLSLNPDKCEKVYQACVLMEKLDKKHGQGVYTWASGNVYRGGYWEDERNCIYKGGNIIKRGGNNIRGCKPLISYCNSHSTKANSYFLVVVVRSKVL